MTKRGKLAVLGSINADHILNLPQFPRPGETVIGKHYQIAYGGKGANQAVAAGRAGADVTFIACIGCDDIGSQMREQFRCDGIKVDAIDEVEDEATGVALIYVNGEGENAIGIYAGANRALTPERVSKRQQIIAEADALLIQLESPLESVQLAAEIAVKNGSKVILNPAPATRLSDQFLALIDIITPNETEAQILTGIVVNDDQSAASAAQLLHQKGIPTVIITLGSRGVWLSEQGRGKRIAGFKVDAVDTIAAGDTFNGALITALLESQSMDNAILFAHAAAAIAVTRSGAQSSVPRRQEIDRFLQQQR
ncbi:ribokinase [Erwinia sp. OLTSP20]|uniref:ribokinase n=1 Tax=unclassified Erwinia TaxID=2622719 RepID=UPI000C17F6EB|nr:MULTISPECIES: ribokinase [unclassified Erwinia]PIJ48325.1 ribokinase [Erwinia sp. OAMSP11]PIJ72318.1 ribokinase [Erwinia sp. OLSSP12]PIJ80023.1 ribokinase [Erwinia sp. OLMTSP26]PIJ81677.1 ribokinase [Erwinia sp. OLCASP19]PIJ84214.1 ribokinase [Erwinia sp. OLMDSP33]